MLFAFYSEKLALQAVSLRPLLLCVRSYSTLFLLTPSRQVKRQELVLPGQASFILPLRLCERIFHVIYPQLPRLPPAPLLALDLKVISQQPLRSCVSWGRLNSACARDWRRVRSEQEADRGGRPLQFFRGRALRFDPCPSRMRGDARP